MPFGVFGRGAGELRDLIADLPALLARTSLPSDIVGQRHAPRSADRRLIGKLLLFPAGAGLAVAFSPAGVLVATPLQSAALLLTLLFHS